MILLWRCRVGPNPARKQLINFFLASVGARNCPKKSTPPFTLLWRCRAGPQPRLTTTYPIFSGGVRNRPNQSTHPFTHMLRCWAGPRPRPTTTLPNFSFFGWGPNPPKSSDTPICASVPVTSGPPTRPPKTTLPIFSCFGRDSKPPEAIDTSIYASVALPGAPHPARQELIKFVLASGGARNHLKEATLSL